MLKNFFTIHELAEILDVDSQRIEDCYLSGRLDPSKTTVIGETRCIPAFYIKDVKAAIQEVDNAS
ncbi:hypothetical protein [Sedimentisphaera salicampi]|uniref:Helix-turn-helix domain protein n=1 Tax=Sedimentisphaera salicampi TaxID=1941349 RepID=A0A1W6LL49_9BACT|nr:hypothetical protein [Sedimentisphaera salicampi]ARN56520.1 hypothetical protein STSP1_00903 [Sedimentisphaera salicampi]